MAWTFTLTSICIAFLQKQHKYAPYMLTRLIYLTDLINVFEVFLPQLLLYPNPTDPLNGEAAALLMREPHSYNQKVKGAHGCSQHSRFLFLLNTPIQLQLQRNEVPHFLHTRL